MELYMHLLFSHNIKTWKISLFITYFANRPITLYMIDTWMGFVQTCYMQSGLSEKILSL